ncbi:MAG: DUF885 domain-containing protein [Pseudomarimonas sp.]
MSLRLTASLLVVLALAPGVQASESTRLSTVLDAYWEENLQRGPVGATAIGDLRYNDQFPNSIGPEFIASGRAATRHWLKELDGIDRNQLSGQDRLSYDILRRDLQESIAGEKFPGELIPINQFGGVPGFLAQLSSGKSLQPFKTVKHYDDFLARADHMLVWIDQAIVNMREGVKRGVVQPRPVMQKVLPQLADLVKDAPEESVFWGAAAAIPADFDAKDRERIQAAYRTAISERWLPALRRLHDYIRDDYMPHTRDSVSLAALPDGAAWYAFRVKAMTTTDLDPEAIHALGLSEVARILGEMDAVRREVKFEGDLKAFFKHLANDDRFYFKSEAEVIAAYQDVQKRIDAQLPKLFDIFPKANYEVRPVEAFRAASAAGASYQSASPDGSRPGVFYINTHNLRAQPNFIVETLSIHEASPGHHFQGSIAQEVENLPAFRRFDTNYVAYSEGWALYAESLGKELGLFTDPYQWYGRLSDEQLRAMRLVVDTGLHHKGWTREQAIQYMLDNSSMAESDVVSEVERYIVIPGQALGYKIGQFAIRELRVEAEKALGEQFDVKAFHRQVLVDGALPMDVLRAKIREWIVAEQARITG